jgi:hypothetical protein
VYVQAADSWEDLLSDEEDKKEKAAAAAEAGKAAAAAAAAEAEADEESSSEGDEDSDDETSEDEGDEDSDSGSSSGSDESSEYTSSEEDSDDESEDSEDARERRIEEARVSDWCCWAVMLVPTTALLGADSQASTSAGVSAAPCHVPSHAHYGVCCMSCHCCLNAVVHPLFVSSPFTPSHHLTVTPAGEAHGSP